MLYDINEIELFASVSQVKTYFSDQISLSDKQEVNTLASVSDCYVFGALCRTREACHFLRN